MSAAELARRLCLLCGLLAVFCLPLAAGAQSAAETRQALEQLAQEGRLTVRALRAWGQLPSGFDQVLLDLRAEGVDLLDSDLGQMQALIARRGDGEHQAALQALADDMAALSIPPPVADDDPLGLRSLPSTPDPAVDLGTRSLDRPLPHPVLTLLEQFEQEHGERLADDLRQRLTASWSLYHGSTMQQMEAILRAEQIPPRERMFELDVYLRSREGEWTLGSVGHYVTGKGLDYLRDQAISSAITLYAPYLGVPFKLIMGANSVFSFLPGFSVGYGDDLIALLEKEQNTARHAEVHAFLRRARTLSEAEIRQSIARHDARIADNNAALLAIPDELRRTVMAELPSGIENLLPELDRGLLWLYASGEPMPPGLRIQIEHRMRNNPQWDRWIRAANRHFLASWQQTLALLREQVLLQQLNEAARLRLAADNICLGRTFEARSPEDARWRVAFGFVLMSPEDVVARVSAMKGEPLDGNEAEEMLRDTARNALFDETRFDAIQAALPDPCFRQVTERELYVMFHGPYRSTRSDRDMVVNDEWLRGFRTRSLGYWDGTNQIRSEQRWDPTGRIRDEQEWYANGQLRFSRQWRDGKRHGVEREWREDGSRLRETYWRDGVKEGRETRWHDNGVRSEERHYRADRLHGKEQRWHINGTLAQRAEYQDGRITGLYTAWYNNGQKYEEGHYASDSQIAIKQGLWLRWDRDGKCIEATEHVWDSAEGIRFSRQGRCP